MQAGLLAAQSDGIGIELITRVGGICAVIAAVGLVLVLPLFLIHRSEIKRLTRWRELEPDRGEGAGGQPVTPPLGSGPRSTGTISPAERVTGERPALQRITAERAALQDPSFWRRLTIAGPRHPLIISVAALGLSVIAVLAAYLALRADGNGDAGSNGLDRSEVEVIVLNGSSQPALAEKVAESLQVAGFGIVGTRATGAFDDTLVLFAPGEMRGARAVARELGEEGIRPMSREIRSVANGAGIVVVAGEDRSGAREGGGGRRGGRGA